MQTILFVRTVLAVPPNLIMAWEKRGYRVVKTEENFVPLAREQVEDRITYFMQQDNIEAVFSFDFLLTLAECCEQHRIKYISWIVDCPHLPLLHKVADNPYAYKFVFDYEQLQMLESRGIQQTFHLPLCASVETFQKCINEREGTRDYKADVTFVANLYTSTKHMLYDRITFLPPYVEGYLDALFSVQRKIWGEYLLYDGIGDSVWNQIKQYVKADFKDNYQEGAYELFFSRLLAEKLTQLERKEVCSYLASHYDFVLYTESDTSFDPMIKNEGSVDYLTEMPLVFHDSRINIHITLRSITSGVSQRVLDVLACGGFLLTNYQPEIAEYFVDGEELVMYSDFNDMYAKIDYYLAHEEERRRIAHAGYLKVKELFNYDVGVGKIIEVVENKNE